VGRTPEILSHVLYQSSSIFGLTRARFQQNLLVAMFTLDQVVPWGRSFDEYRSTFALTDDVSCDPIYRFEKPQIQERICCRVANQSRRCTSLAVACSCRP
jgi:hypothetical protein